MHALVDFWYVVFAHKAACTVYMYMLCLDPQSIDIYLASQTVDLSGKRVTVLHNM